MNKKISFPIAITITVLCAVVVGGVAVWQYLSMPKEESLEGALGDETADWKTYRNEEYGYEIKYPKNWYSYTSNPADIYLQPEEEVPGAIPGPYANAFEVKITLISPDTTLLLAIQDDFKKERKEEISFSQENINIGGIDGLRIKTICEGVGCGAPEWFVIKDNYLYHFNSNLGYSGTFDQILSTFNFIEIKDETADWKVYRKEKYGFEIKYPNDWDSPIESGDTDALTGNYSGFFKEGNVLLAFSIDVYENDKNLSLKDWWEQEFYEKLNVKYDYSYEGVVSISPGIESAKYKLERAGFEDICYLISKNRKVYTIYFSVLPGVEEIQQMLSTFRFID